MEEATQELLQRERVRAEIESILEDYLEPTEDGAVRIEAAVDAARRFAALGLEAVPYLVNELEADRYETADLCAYALGLIRDPESEAALREALVRADDTATDVGRTRKAWAAWALGLHGRADALRLLTEGRHRPASYSIHAKMSVMETIAIQTAPDSVPILLDLLEALVGQDERWNERQAVLRALRRVGDPAAAPALIALLAHPDSNLRREAANSLIHMPTPESVAALIRTLADQDSSVRSSVALALEYIGPRTVREPVVAHLAEETDPLTRGALYRLLADTSGDEAFALLAPYRARSDATDRRLLVEAMARVTSPQRLGVLREALADPDNGVALEAAAGLGRDGSDPALEALASAVDSARINVAEAAAQQLALNGASRWAAAIQKRLTDDLLAEPLSDPRLWPVLEHMLEALVTLGYTPGMQSLSEAAERQTDVTVKGLLDRELERLALIRSNGRRAARWIESTAAQDPATRRLAWTQLARIGTAQATRALVTGFDGAEPGDRLVILEALGDLTERQSEPLLRRVLLDAEFDHPHRLAQRDMAAWSARRIGSPACSSLLAAAAERRDGRDPRVLVYAGVLGGERALPLLRALRKPRLRYVGWTIGVEQERLDWLANRLADGRSVAAIDLPPARIFFR